MKKFILTIAVLSSLSFSAWGWGNNGHDAIAYIAECNIKESTRTILNKYLDGYSIVYYSSWMDQMRRNPSYAGTLEGHSFAVNEDFEVLLTEDPKNTNYSTKDDGLYLFLQLIESVSGGKYKQMSDEEVARAIKIIVHLVADYHCPSHIRYPKAVSKEIIYADKKQKYHTFWDTAMITRVHKWNYLEYGHALGCLSEAHREEITRGDMISWCEENARLCAPIHEWVNDGDKVTDQLVYEKALPLADLMIQRAGYRLAKVLDEIFN